MSAVSHQPKSAEPGSPVVSLKEINKPKSAQIQKSDAGDKPCRVKAAHQVDLVTVYIGGADVSTTCDDITDELKLLGLTAREIDITLLAEIGGRKSVTVSVPREYTRVPDGHLTSQFGHFAQIRGKSGSGQDASPLPPLASTATPTVGTTPGQDGQERNECAGVSIVPTTSVTLADTGGSGATAETTTVGTGMKLKLTAVDTTTTTSQNLITLDTATVGTGKNLETAAPTQPADGPCIRRRRHWSILREKRPTISALGITVLPALKYALQLLLWTVTGWKRLLTLF